MSLSQFIVGVVILHLAVSNPVPFYKKLSSEKAARLAAWTPESKQSMGELSGQFEGDIILRPNQRNGLINETFRWPNGVIPYEISSDFTEWEKQFITNSLKQYGRTCITVRPREEGDADYVYVTGSEPGCFSEVGYMGGRQILNLQRRGGCITRGTIVHEFLHAAGFWHQQNVHDRDDYVSILWENIIEKEKYNFEKFGSDELSNFGEKYDYLSIVHYGTYAFSANGLPTIVPKKPHAIIGQNKHLSRTDIIKLNKMYKCN